MWEDLEAKALIIFTKTWRLAKLAASYRPKIKTYAFTNSKRTESVSNSYFWINPIYLEEWDSVSFKNTLEKSIIHLKEKNLLINNDRIVVISDLQKWEYEIPVMEIIKVWEFV